MMDEKIEMESRQLEQFLQYADNSWNIPIWKIEKTGLFESLEEIEVFFFSFDGYYYNTDIALINRLGHIYIDILDKLNENRLFYE